MKELLRSPLFWLGLALRLAALPFFGSHYTKDLFIPFLDGAVQHPGTNPWTLFPPQFFPYGSFLFALLYVPRQLAFWAFGDAVLQSAGLSMALCKAPLLAVDLLFLRQLARFAPRVKPVLLHYWLNPILFFITYVHGQLDIVVTAFCFLSVMLLLEQRMTLSAIAMAAALSSKFHVALVIPFLVAYLWNREFLPKSLKQIAAWTSVFVGLSALGFIPVLTAGDMGYTSVASPEALRIFAARLDFGSGSVLFIGIAAVLAVLGRLCVATMITPRGLLFGSGMLFGVLVLVTNAAPGWYFWTVPYVSLLYATHQNAPRFPWYLCQLAYLVNFALLPAWSGLPEALLAQAHGVAFTVLQTTLGGLLLITWVVAVREEAKLKRFIKPLMIGIAGDSGAGKNRLSAALSDVFEAQRTVLLEGDDYHKWERGDDRYARYTHLSPKANNLRTLEAHAEELGGGRMVFQRHYDHGSGRFSKAREIKSARTIVVQGLHTFYLRNMRDRFDLRIFLAPDERIRLAWKIKRDVGQRGHTLAKVVGTLDARQADSDRHIAPQRRHADWIMEAVPRTPITRDDVIAGMMPEIAMRHVLWNEAHVAALIDELSRCPECWVRMEHDGEDLDRVVMTVTGEPTAQAIGAVAQRLFVNLRHVTRGLREPVWRGGHDGVAQLIALTMLGTRALTSEEGGTQLGAHQAPDQPDGRARGGGPPVGDRAGRPVDGDPKGDVASSA